MSLGYGILAMVIFPLKALVFLPNKFVVRSLPMINVQDNSCENCILSIERKDNFLVGALYGAKEPLEIVHKNLYGLMKI